ncbi:MAG: hypothetical protein HZB26_05925 [Candidatus Hydrogenedentes bacterium]|nr:hypothetical protein [Candidatus Hydrogenedentota bacterium]
MMLDGGGSEAYGTTISSYVWTGAPDPDDVATPALLGLPLGVYEFTLVVTDSEAHAGAPDTVTIFVKRPSDINGDQAFNAVDVQLVINAALGLDIGGLDADVDGNADVNAVDVQTVTNAALGVG